MFPKIKLPTALIFVSLFLILGLSSPILATSDLAGWYNQGTTFTISNLPDEPTLVSPADGTFFTTPTPTLETTFFDENVDNTGQTHYRLATSSANDCFADLIQSGTSATTTSNAANTSFAVSIPIGDGEYFWCAQNDNGTQTSDWVLLGSFIIDTTPPVINQIEIFSDQPNYFFESDTDLNNADDKIYFNSQDNAGAEQTITIAIQLVETNPDLAQGSTAFNDTPTDDSDSINAELVYTIETNATSVTDLSVTAIDKAGHSTTATIDFILDNTPPTATSAPLMQDQTTANPNYTDSPTVDLVWDFTEETSAISGWLVSEASTPPEITNENWSTLAIEDFTFTSENGDKELYFWVKDLVNNISIVETATITLDTLKPTLDFTDLTEFYDEATFQTITGTAVDTNSPITAVEIKIQRTADNYYFNGLTWQTTETWLTAAALDGDFNNSSEDFTLTSLNTENLNLDTTYNFTARASDSAEHTTNETNYATASFTYVSDLPLITQLTITSDQPNYFTTKDLITAGGTVYFNSNEEEGAGQKITITASTSEDNVSFLCASAFDDTPNVDTTEPYEQTYSVENNIGDQNNINCTLTNNENNEEQEVTINFLEDNADPEFTTAVLLNPVANTIWQSETTQEIIWDSTQITDNLVGLAENYLTLEYTTDETNWTKIADVELSTESFIWPLPDLTSETVKLRLTVHDQVGNAKSYSSAAFTINDFTIQIIAGNHQLGDLDSQLAEELKVQVIADISQASLANIPLTFSITQVPIDPLAENQALSAGTFGLNSVSIDHQTLTVETDADGFASAQLKLGDRAGEYTITVNLTNNLTDSPTTFTAIERELFEVILTEPNLDLTVNPLITNELIDENPVNLIIQTNATYYQINLKTDAWPTNQTTGIFLLGLNWLDTTNNSQNFNTPNTFTNVFSCNNDCQGIQNFSLDLQAVIDYDTDLGDYENQIEIQGTDLRF